MPAAIDTSCIITDDPAAITGETLLSLAIIVIAAIDQIFPGTYLPRLETNQIRAASLNGSVSPDATITLRHVSIRSTYVRSTIIVASPIHDQSG